MVMRLCGMDVGPGVTGTLIVWQQWVVQRSRSVINYPRWGELAKPSWPLFSIPAAIRLESGIVAIPLRACTFCPPQRPAGPSWHASRSRRPPVGGAAAPACPSVLFPGRRRAAKLRLRGDAGSCDTADLQQCSIRFPLGLPLPGDTLPLCSALNPAISCSPRCRR